MRITVGNYNFYTIKDFTTHLETTYEQEQVSGEVTISMECDAFVQEHFDELVRFLLSPERTRLYKFEFPPSQPHYQLTFDNVYLVSKRQKFSLEFQPQLARVTDAAGVFEPLSPKIRKAKKNWLEGSKGAAISLKFQQPLQEPKLQEKQKTVQRKPKEGEPVLEAVVEAEKINAEDLGELVERDSLDRAEWLDFTKKQFPVHTPNLPEVWDRLVGKNANQVKEQDRKITHVQAVAMQQIIRNYPEFSYGLLFENLPAGFYMQPTLDGKNVLCFSEEPQYQHAGQITPLTLMPDFAQTKARSIHGTYHQFSFLEKDSDNLERYDIEFTHLLSSKSSPEQRQAAFLYFISKFTQQDKLKFEQISSLLKMLPLSDLNYQGLAQVMTHAGADGVLLLLHHLHILSDRELFKDFNELFLDNPENYLALMSAQGLANLQKLAELSSEQKTWWVALVSQHKAAGARTEFNELFNAYDYFLGQLAEKKLKLPLSCALEHIRHMKPALDRLLFLINNSSDPEEQLIWLDGLDFDVQGVYYACRYDHYKLVSRQMDLKPATNNAPLDYSVPSVPHELSTLFVVPHHSYEELLAYFYRFIGQQEWAFNLDVYQSLEKEISGNNKLSTENKALLLNIVALVTTGKRACTHTEDPDLCIKNCINTLIAIAEQLHEDLHYKSALISLFAEALAGHSRESMPTASELNAIIEILLLTQSAEIEPSDQAGLQFYEMSLLALNLLKDYGDSALLIFDNYKSRAALEQTNALPVEKFSSLNLLKHLVAPSKLNKFLPDLFQDQPELLPRFIALFSLLSDEIPNVSQHDAEDSQFETRIKILAGAIHDLQPEHRELLLATFNGINIEGSYGLPSLEQLIEVVDSVKLAEEQLNEIKDIEDQKTSILEIVGTKLPHLQIGKAEVHEPVLNLFSLMRHCYEEWQLEDRLASLPEKLKGYLESWLDSHLVVLYYLKNYPQSTHTILNLLQEEEQEVKSLLGGRRFSWALSGLPQAKLKMAEVLGDEFFSENSFLAVLQPRIEASLQSGLNKALHSLHLENKDFELFLINHINDFDPDLPMEEAFLEWGRQIDEVNGLLNALTRIKNKNNIDFHRCISLLSEVIKPTVSGKKALSVVQVRDLLNTLSQDVPPSIASPLSILCNALNNTSHYTAEQLNRVLSEVDYLTKYRGLLGQKAYDSLLHKSCTYNLTQESLFPLKELIGIHSLNGVDKELSEGLFTSLISLINNANQQVDEQLLKQIIDKLTSILEKKAEVSSLYPLLTLLMGCANGKEQSLPDLIDRLTHLTNSDLTICSKILLILGKQTTDEHSRLLEVMKSLEANQHHLKKFEKLFVTPPYPQLEPFLQVLNAQAIDLMAFIEVFDKDPQAGRAPQKNEFDIVVKDSEQILDEQFDVSKTEQTIASIQDIAEGTLLGEQEQYDLAQQISYLNAIGRAEPFTLVVDKEKPTQRIIKHSNLTQVSRAQLRELSDILIDSLRKPGLNADEKLKAELKLLAVLREQYFRATGTFANATQLLSILVSLKCQRNMLMELDTEEAPVTSALLAVMQWVQADGGTVDVCTSSQQVQILNDKNQGIKNFFASLGIDASSIKANSPKGTYQIGGINYSTAGDLALYRLQAKVADEHLLAYKNGHPLPSHLILCGTDFSKFDDRTTYCMVQDNGEQYSYTWVYPLIDEFINHRAFKTLYPGKVLSEEKDREQLKEFLDKHAPTGLDKVQLSSLPDEQFDLWINAAIEAQRLVEGEDFSVLTSKNGLHFAIPLNQKEFQEGFTFMSQQFLHARLKKENPDCDFIIEPEMTLVHSTSLRDLIYDYQKQGRIIGLSKTSSKKDELEKQCIKWGIETQFAISSHQKNRALAKEHVSRILDAVKQAEEGQPVVLIAEDDNEVKRLEFELKNHFSTKKITALTGTESITSQEQGIKNSSGKNESITIVSATCQNDVFNTRHPKGFLTIQTRLDATGPMGQLIQGFVSHQKRGRHIAIYETRQGFDFYSCAYSSIDDCTKMFAELGELEEELQEQAAVEQFFTHRVSEIQQAVLHQFQEWKEFLHLVFPKSEWRNLDARLLNQKNDLTRILDRQWVQLLEYFDLQKIYPYPQRDWETGKGVPIEKLNEVLRAYEHAVNSVWEEKRALLKEMAQSVIAEDPINTLRCHYLDGVSLTEQLKLNHLFIHKNNQEMLVGNKKTTRTLLSGLDVNGAMLRFADGDVDSYRAEFVKTLMQSCAKDIYRLIENTTHLNKKVKAMLLEQVAHARNSNTLLCILLDYANVYLPEDQFAEKYAMQPVVKELLRIYKEAGLPKTAPLQNLQKIYVDNVEAELVDDLETALFWAKEQNRGLGYWLERSAVRTAAEAILDAVQKLKTARNLAEKKDAIRNLYQVLSLHQAQLEDLWIFSFGHKNTRTLIQDTLTTLNELTTFGAGENELDAEFLHECYEESLYEVLKGKLIHSIETIEEDTSWLQENEEWQTIKNTLDAMLTQNKTVYVFQEMYLLLSKKIEEAAAQNSPLQNAFVHMRGTMRTLFEAFSQEHKELLTTSTYLTSKAEHIKLKLESIGYHAKEVNLRKGNCGFSEYFDLVIEGPGAHDSFADFIHYNSRASELIKEREILLDELKQADKEGVILWQVINEQLPLLKPRAKTKADKERFPEQFQEQVHDILVLKERIAAEQPEDLLSFPEKIRNNFLDRELVKTFRFPQLQSDEIEKIHDVMLKIAFRDLHERVIEGTKKKSLLGTAYSYVSSYVFTPETMEDWEFEFNVLVNRPTEDLENALRPDIEQKYSKLAKKLSALQQKTTEKIESLKKQIDFLNEKIEDEEKKSGVYVKRFTHLTELIEFEDQLMNYKAHEEVNLPPHKNPEFIEPLEAAHPVQNIMELFMI